MKQYCKTFLKTINNEEQYFCCKKSLIICKVSFIINKLKFKNNICPFPFINWLFIKDVIKKIN
ncbi:hypothetical protein QN326_07280 [Candidatus Phytoplasma asteris]|uniref:Uncharacterized protein n=1 Tax=Candidatus Phytoplasma asteris TaxID=85620 RepID=A0ABZ3CDE3_9MOLU